MFLTHYNEKEQIEIERAEAEAIGRAEGEALAKAEGIKAVVDTAKCFVGDDTERIIKAVKNNKAYADLTDEEIKEYI